jgi:dTDP-4-amino-4,6-dideoxygalactose transaminase
VLVDIDPGTRCADPRELAAKVGPDTAAVVPVHLYGRPVDPGDPGVPVLEDACQAHGADIGGKRAGALGTAAAFSFYPSKNLGALGDGGAVVTNDPEVDALVRSLRAHGSEPGNANNHLRPGATGRLDTLQAAFLRAKLPHLDGWNEERREAAARYREVLDGLPLTLPPEDPYGGRQVFHLFVVEVDDRDRVLADLRAAGIGAAMHYPTACHLQPAWRHLGYDEGAFPAAEALAARGLSLPIFPGITEGEIDEVAAVLRAAL